MDELASERCRGAGLATVILATVTVVLWSRSRCRLSRNKCILSMRDTAGNLTHAAAIAGRPRPILHSPANSGGAGRFRVRFAISFANAKLFRVPLAAQYLAGLLPRGSTPTGLWAGCYDPHSGGEFLISDHQ